MSVKSIRLLALAASAAGALLAGSAAEDELFSVHASPPHKDDAVHACTTRVAQARAGQVAPRAKSARRGPPAPKRNCLSRPRRWAASCSSQSINSRSRNFKPPRCWKPIAERVAVAHRNARWPSQRGLATQDYTCAGLEESFHTRTDESLAFEFGPNARGRLRKFGVRREGFTACRIC